MSGFSTCAQESQYSRMTENLVLLLSSYTLKGLRGEFRDNRHFKGHLVKLYTRMHKLELQKRLPPKVSGCFYGLAAHCARSNSGPQVAPKKSGRARKLPFLPGLALSLGRTQRKKRAKRSSSQYYEGLMKNYMKRPRASCRETPYFYEGMFLNELQDSAY